MFCRRGRSSSTPGGRGWFEVVEELVLETVEDADKEIFAFDGLARPIVEGDHHCCLVGGGSGKSGRCLSLDFRHGVSLPSRHAVGGAVTHTVSGIYTLRKRNRVFVLAVELQIGSARSFTPMSLLAICIEL